MRDTLAMLRKAAELYRYRELLKALVTTELKLRYRRSVLGFLWTMLNPFLTMVVLTVVFSTIMRFNIEHYSVMLLAGILPWSFFAQSVGLSLMSVVGKGSLLRQVYIPKSAIPLAAVLACLVNFLLALIPLFLLMIIVGRPIHLSALFLPVPIVLLLLFTCGVAFIFSCLNVFFRDFTHMTEVLLSMWFYLSPVFYTPDLVPEGFRHMFAWNPLYYLITCFRDPIYNGRLPSPDTLLAATITSVLVCGLGFFVFTHFERSFVVRV